MNFKFKSSPPAPKSDGRLRYVQSETVSVKVRGKFSVISYLTDRSISTFCSEGKTRCKGKNTLFLAAFAVNSRRLTFENERNYFQTYVSRFLLLNRAWRLHYSGFKFLVIMNMSVFKWVELPEQCSLYFYPCVRVCLPSWREELFSSF